MNELIHKYKVLLSLLTNAQNEDEHYYYLARTNFIANAIFYLSLSYTGQTVLYNKEEHKLIGTYYMETDVRTVFADLDTKKGVPIEQVEYRDYEFNYI